MMQDRGKEQNIQDWLIEVAGTIAHGLEMLQETQRVTTRRDDIGVNVTVYFNWPTVIKVDIVRQDKKGFFALPLPYSEERQVEQLAAASAKKVDLEEVKL